MKKRQAGYLHTKFIQFLIENEKVKAKKIDDDEMDDEVEVDDEMDDEVEVDDEVDADEVIERVVQILKKTAEQYDDIIQRQKSR